MVERSTFEREAILSGLVLLIDESVKGQDLSIRVGTHSGMQAAGTLDEGVSVSLYGS